jgi:hypothetical protein
MANEKHDIIKLVILDIYKKRISDLLHTIHNNYPQKFKKELITLELNNILNNIIFNIDKLQPKITKSIVSRKGTNIKNENMNVNIEEKNVDISKRCKARIWNSIFDRKTGKEVVDIESCYKVFDFNDIDNVKFYKKYIIGSRCSKKQSSDKNYCVMHSKHTPHGNFDELPNKEICFHFIKAGNY